MIVIGNRVKSKYATPGFSYGELFRELERKREEALSSARLTGDEYDIEIADERNPAPSPNAKKEDLLFQLVSYRVLHHSPRAVCSSKMRILIEDLDSGKTELEHKFEDYIHTAGVTSRGEIIVFNGEYEKLDPTMHVFVVEEREIHIPERKSLIPGRKDFPASSMKELFLVEKEEKRVLIEDLSSPIGVTGTRLVYKGRETQIKSLEVSSGNEPLLIAESEGYVAIRDNYALILEEGESATLFDVTTGKQVWRLENEELWSVGKVFLFSPTQFGFCGNGPANFYTKKGAVWEMISSFDESTNVFARSGNKILSSDDTTLEVHGMKTETPRKVGSGVDLSETEEEPGSVVDITREKDEVLYKINIFASSGRWKPSEDDMLELPGGRILYNHRLSRRRFVVDVFNEEIENQKEVFEGERCFLFPVDEEERKRFRDFLSSACSLADVLVDIVERFI